MILDLPPDPSLKDLQLPFEWRYNQRRGTWVAYAKEFSHQMEFFGPDRKPRDIFRSDVAAYREYLKKKGNSDNTIAVKLHIGLSFYKLLDELGVVEAGYNPFAGMSPRRVRVRKYNK